MGDKKGVPRRVKKTAPELPGSKSDAAKATEFVPPRSAPTEPASQVTKIALDDEAMDSAIDAIMANESDEILAAQDAASAPRTGGLVIKHSFKQKAMRLIKNKWSWAIVGLMIFALFVLPFTRYQILGLFIKRQVTIQVVDRVTAAPVTKATVSIGTNLATTDSNGQAKLTTKVGKSSVKVLKQYYSTAQQKIFVGVRPSGLVTIKLLATGRQVPIKVINTITGKPVGNVDIQVNDTSAKTDAGGLATMVLPTKQSSYKASLTLAGYNAQAVTVTVSDKLTSTNIFNLTPAGTIYFLAKDAGQIDVVKSNLDGTSRTVVLAGTGKEDPTTTSLLATRDWKFLVLKASRDSTQPALYIIDTASDKVTQFDSGNASFNLVGWYGHNFVYDVTQNSLQLWQAGRETVKSYNADAGTPNKLDQNQAEGTSSSYAYQVFSNFYVLEGQVVYVTQWVGVTPGGTYDLSSKNDTARAVQLVAQTRKDYKNWPSATTTSIATTLSQPQVIYYSVVDNSQTTYYQYQNQAVSVANISQNTFNLPAQNYYLSPAGSKTFWLNNGSLFIGDKDSQHGSQVKGLGGYGPYGWYGEDFVLATSGGNIYIAPSSGVAAGTYPVKISNYFKSAVPYIGYGYGYGW